MRAALLRLRLLCALVLALSAGALLAMVSTAPVSPAWAQPVGDAPRDGGARDSGRNPTADSVKEDALLRELGRARGIVSIPDDKAAMLEQPQGRAFQAWHERYLPWIGGLSVLGMFGVLAVFYAIVGSIGSHDQVSGVKIKRFNWFERWNHWMTATTFLVLSVTGLNYFLGKRLILPIIGNDAFTVWSQWAKYAHNFLTLPFALGILAMFLLWVRDNIPNRLDWLWIRKLGGARGHVDAERFNAGQKAIFWIVVIGGALMTATGTMLLFPFHWADINGMQLAHASHALIGVGLLVVIMGHIYIGTLGMKGAYDAMGSGEVDLAWAKAHHSLWVEEQMAKNASGPQVGPRAAPAE